MNTSIKDILKNVQVEYDLADDVMLPVLEK